MMPSPYLRYKSGPAKWLGDVPEYWTVERIKYSLAEKRARSAPDLPAGAISYGRVIAKDGERLPEETRATYQEVLAGEYLINPINLNYDLISLRTALSSIDVVVSPAYIVAKPDTAKLLPAFGSYLLYVFDIRHMKSLGAGVRQTIGFKDIGNCYWALPPLSEQEAIATFLNNETGRIDGLIEKKGRFIDLLCEKQVATITSAVVNGIRPDACKQSMVPWVSESPGHWTVMPLSAIATRDGGLFIDGDWIESKDLSDEGIRYITTGNVGRGVYKEQGSGFISEDTFRRLNCTQVLPGDILVSRLNSPIARACIVPDLNRCVVTSVDNVIVRPSPAYDRRFLVYLFSSAPHFFNTENLARGTTMQRISRSALGRIRFAVPDFAEQIEIADHLDREVGKLQRLIAKTERSIELLKEHRSALITAAVTGKIDVRGLAAQNMKAAA